MRALHFLCACAEPVSRVAHAQNSLQMSLDSGWVGGEGGILVALTAPLIAGALCAGGQWRVVVAAGFAQKTERAAAYLL